MHKSVPEIRNDHDFDLFWELVQRTKEDLNVNEPALHRQRKRPRRYEDGVGEPSTFDSPMLYYRSMYYQCIDAAVVAIQDRFYQYDYTLYSMLEQLLIKASSKGDYTVELKEVTDFYSADFNKSELETQLQLLSCMDIKCSKQSITFKDIHNHFQSLPASQLSLLSEVARLVKFVLLMPATNAVSERSASAMRRIKTYLRSTMTQLQMNNVMVLHIHKHLTDEIDVVAALNEFVSANEDRRRHFGYFH